MCRNKQTTEAKAGGQTRVGGGQTRVDPKNPFIGAIAFIGTNAIIVAEKNTGHSNKLKPMSTCEKSLERPAPWVLGVYSMSTCAERTQTKRFAQKNPFIGVIAFIGANAIIVAEKNTGHSNKLKPMSTQCLHVQIEFIRDSLRNKNHVIGFIAFIGADAIIVAEQKEYWSHQ